MTINQGENLIGPSARDCCSPHTPASRLRSAPRRHMVGWPLSLYPSPREVSRGEGSMYSVSSVSPCETRAVHAHGWGAISTCFASLCELLLLPRRASKSVAPQRSSIQVAGLGMAGTVDGLTGVSPVSRYCA